MEDRGEDGKISLRFVTTNRGKVDFLRVVLESAAADSILQSVEMCDMELPELQADSVAKICAAKTEEAFRLLGGNVVVQDSGFVIEALNGFPGPYTKYVLSTIGVDGLLKLMDGQLNRRCGFAACVGFADARGKVHIFEEPMQYFGSLRESGQLFEVFIPDDAVDCDGLTLGEMSEKQLTMYRQQRHSAFKVFANWLLKEYGQKSTSVVTHG
ncbi:unnamed protein product [Symbiodinium necroappetens]|uniref:Inosine triphosphate pyrophosphatase n=1 Tax=Symbiodinium necroappetens TaxID=1628268 RepID=A0A812KKT5_9DINO|nr:unnamed protein product [Symbiodinium necroappetens]